MASTGVKYPGTVEDDASVGTAAWVNPGNAAADDGVSAVASLFVEQSHYIVARNFDFSAIPSGATIDSVVVSVKRDGSSGNVTDVVVKLWQAGPVGDNHAINPGYWGGPGEDQGYSGFGTWGLTLAVADVQDADFGVCISVENDSGGALPAIDFVSIEILYTPAAEDPPAPALQDSLGLLTSRRLVARRSPQISSIGADDAIIFADQPSETPLCGPGLLDSRPRRAKRAKPSYAGGFADNLTDELASLDSSSALLFASPRRPINRTIAASVVTNSPPPDESHPCGCVGTAEIVEYGFATAEFVGGASAENGGGEFTAEIVEDGYTAEIIDACDCED